MKKYFAFKLVHVSFPSGVGLLVKAVETYELTIGTINMSVARNA